VGLDRQVDDRLGLLDHRPAMLAPPMPKLFF
jgi:hypothetical protein